MKNLKLLFLAALLCGFTLSVNAQSVSSDYETFWMFPTLCDGEFYFVTGMVYGHRVEHFNPKTEELEWIKFTVKADDLVWDKNDEIFSVSFYHKWDYDPEAPVRTYIFNLKGDQGSHIIFNRVLKWDEDLKDWVKIKDHAKCVQ